LVKVTTEKLPKSLLALDIELERDQVEKGLDRAARRLSQKVNVPGFRKGKAPRFILENYFGRDALVEEATDDLVNKAFREVLEQQQIEPFGPASLDGPPQFDQEPFHFRVLIPVAPTTQLPDYRAIRAPLNVDEVTDETVEQAMEALRDRHVVLREPEEPRPAQQGDQLVVELESSVDGEPLDDRDENGAVRESTLVMEPDRLVAGLYEGLLGIQPDETRELNVQMPEDHANERVAGKEVLFKIKLLRIQERLLPDWEELPVLEEFEGTLDELRAKTRKDLEETARESAARETTDAFIKQMVEQSEYDIPDALIEREADELLHRQGHEFERYGITLDQMLQYRGKTHDEAVEELKPQAEERLKTTLALREVMRAEGLEVDEAEVDDEVERMLDTYEEEQRERARALLTTQLRPTVASSVLDKKLRERLVAIATGEAPALEPAPEPSAEAVEVAATGETDESDA
jgi:trigger factor